MDAGRSFDDALAVLLDEALADVVDMVFLSRDGLIEVHARRGAAAFQADGSQAWTRGRDPFGSADVAGFTPLSEEMARRRPTHGQNHYPFGIDNVAHLFSDARAPDLAVVHTPAHNWEERGGHRGEHGSPGVVQCRAPLIAAGTGIRAHGRLERAARMIDIGPTLAALAGVAPRGDGSLLRRQQGRVLDELLDPEGAPEHVVAILCDGTNANVLYAMAEAGELPAVARLMQAGTTYAHGCIASFPSVTLANHTTALTGVHPGLHGVLHNVYYDRREGRQIVTNAPDRWHLAREEISSHVETVFEAVRRSGGGATAAINEPSDRGASSTTFDLLRSGTVSLDAFTSASSSSIPGATAAFAELKREYAFASVADNLAVRQVRDRWSEGTPPAFLWVNLILPDAAGHAGGPYSDMAYAGLRDTDRRVGELLDLVQHDDRTAVMLLADHGMEESDPGCKGDWDEALAGAGIAFRDEGYGFIYLGDP